jgi:hypothetical protein
MSELTDKAIVLLDDDLQTGNRLKKMALEDNDDVILTLQDKLELLKLAAIYHKNAIDAAKVVVANDTLRHKIFHDNRLLGE